MHKLPNFSQNSWFKIVGIVAVLYFALLSNKENPNSLGNNLKKENLRDGFSEVSKKTQEIYKNVKLAQEFNQRRLTGNEVGYKGVLVIDEFESGSGKIASCNDKVDIEFEIRDVTNKVLQPKTLMQLVIGQNFAPIIEKYVLQMRESSIRILNIPSSYVSKSEILSNIRKQGYSQLVYRIELKKVYKNNQSPYQCL